MSTEPENPRLPPDLITEILTRLPPESLLRCRCLSKFFLSQIDGPDFIARHLTHSLKTHSNLSLILRHSYIRLLQNPNSPNPSLSQLTHPLDPNREGDGTEVIGSCNGLLALYGLHEKLCIWNPYTRTHRILPRSKLEFPDSVGFTVCQFIVYGFGVDPLAGDYKLVRLAQFYGDDDKGFDSVVSVYSLMSNSWRRVRDFPYYLCYKRGFGVLCGGVLHWVVTRKYGDNERLIVGFDLSGEESRVVEQPDYGDGGEFHLNVEVLREKLCVMCNYNAEWVDLWVMQEYGVKESWRRLYSVRLPRVDVGWESYRPLIYNEGGDKVLLDQNGERLVWLDLESGGVEEVKLRNLPKNFEAWVLVGSLVVVSGGGGSSVDAPKKKRTCGNKKKRGRRDQLVIN